MFKLFVEELFVCSETFVKFGQKSNKQFKRFLGLANVERQEFCKHFVEMFVVNKRLQNRDL